MDAKTRATISHNVKGWNAAMDKVAAAATDTCPKCGEAALPVLVEQWGHCMKCQRAAAAAQYGFTA
jgi:hypothetical protein